MSELLDFIPSSPALKTLLARGHVHQSTDVVALDHALMKPTTIFAGFDATADSLHVGHLLPIMTLRRLQQHGHIPIALLGGGTTKVGDPSFRNSTRPMLSDADIQANLKGISQVFPKMLELSSAQTGQVVNNDAWLGSMGFMDVIREIGPHMSVNRMLSFDSVKNRLDANQSLSFLEFNYMILQAIDFLELFRQKGCTVQIGGADQWANILNGIDLIRKMEGGAAFGLTSPLLTNSSGEKMGKTSGGAVWLNAEKLSPFDFWQFWRNVEDPSVLRMLKLFTDVSLEEIDEMPGHMSINEMKIRLATEVTSMIHGEEAAARAAETARGIFSEHSLSLDLPVVTVDQDNFSEGGGIVDVMVASGLSKSKNESRRLISGNAVSVDGMKVGVDLFIPSFPVIISIGKKKHFKIDLA